MTLVHNAAGSLRYRNLLVVIKQTAYEEYSQVRKKREFLYSYSERILSCCTRLPLVDFSLVKITWTSSQGTSLEATGISLQGTQAMRQ